MKICFKKKAPPRMHYFHIVKLKIIYLTNSVIFSLNDLFNCLYFISGGIAEYFTYVSGLTFEEEPDYRHCKNILAAAIKAYGFEDDGILVFTSGEEKHNSRKVKFVVITDL